MKVRTAQLRSSAIRHGCGAGISGRRTADCVWNPFSMRHRLVGQLLFAVDSLATFATSGKSPIAHRHRFVPISLSAVSEAPLHSVSTPSSSLVGASDTALRLLAPE